MIFMFVLRPPAFLRIEPKLFHFFLAHATIPESRYPDGLPGALAANKYGRFRVRKLENLVGEQADLRKFEFLRKKLSTFRCLLTVQEDLGEHKANNSLRWKDREYLSQRLQRFVVARR